MTRRGNLGRTPLRLPNCAYLLRTLHSIASRDLDTVCDTPAAAFACMIYDDMRVTTP
jgi:hypothetical protein